MEVIRGRQTCQDLLTECNPERTAAPHPSTPAAVLLTHPLAPFVSLRFDRFLTKTAGTTQRTIAAAGSTRGLTRLHYSPMAEHPGPGPASTQLQPGAPASAQPPRPRSPARFWMAVALAIIIAPPIGWAMTPVAPLLGELGLFFFLVVSLLMGAITYRVALPAAPVPRLRLYILTGLVALIVWSANLLTEYLTFPGVAAKAVRHSIYMSLSPERRQRVEDGVRSYIHSQLEANYPPGGMIGYMRWASTSGTMSLPRVIDSTTVPFSLSQRRIWWSIRVVFSLVFTAGAFLSQILALSPRPPSEPEPSDT